MHIPFYKQEKDWSCGAAVARMALAALGIHRAESTLRRQLGTKKGKEPKGYGTPNKNFKRLLSHYPIEIFTKKNATLNDLRKKLFQEYIIIIEYINLEEQEGHYAILKKINSRIHFIDPLAGPHHSYSLATFLPLWHGEVDPTRYWFAAIKKIHK